MTDPARIDAILDLLTTDEVQHALRFIDVMERGQHMVQVEADEWRRRIVARRRFLEIGAGIEPAD